MSARTATSGIPHATIVVSVKQRSGVCLSVCLSHLFLTLMRCSAPKGSIISHVTSFPLVRSRLLSSITPSLFHSHLFHKTFPPYPSYLSIYLKTDGTGLINLRNKRYKQRPDRTITFWAAVMIIRPVYCRLNGSRQYLRLSPM